MLEVDRRMISPKVLIISNLACWIFLVAGIALVTVAHRIGAALAGVTPVAHAYTSTILSGAIDIVTLLVAIPSGYVAAKLAPRAKYLNAALSASSLILVSVGTELWGERVETSVLTEWLNMLSSYGAPVVALLGAYIWHFRADRGLEASKTRVTLSPGQVFYLILALVIAGIFLSLFDPHAWKYIGIGLAITAGMAIGRLFQTDRPA